MNPYINSLNGFGGGFIAYWPGIGVLLELEAEKIVIFLNKGEYGKIIYASVGEDISTGTEFYFIMEPEVGTKLERKAVDGVTLGTTNITVYGDTFIANQYVKYTVKEGDFGYAGLWRFKGMSDLTATNKAIGDYRKITILE